MILMIDTNIILDIILKREPFFEESYLTLLNTEENSDLTLLSASAMTDIFYILRKAVGRQTAYETMLDMQSFVTYSDVVEEDIENALHSPMRDLEDALVAAVAARKKADYIVTRNTADFESSKVPAITPAEFNRLIGMAT